MLKFILSLFRDDNRHPALMGDMEQTYSFDPYGAFKFETIGNRFVQSSDIFGEKTLVQIDVRSAHHLNKAIECLRRLDKDWFEKAILQTADELHMAIEDFGGEPEFWVDRQTFLENIRKDPILQILVEEVDEEEISINLVLNDGELFGGHYICIVVHELGEIFDIGVHG